VSNFEPIKDAADTGLTITIEPRDHNQARLAEMLAQTTADKMVRWFREGIVIEVHTSCISTLSIEQVLMDSVTSTRMTSDNFTMVP
jgi:hypothetical protein